MQYLKKAVGYKCKLCSGVLRNMGWEGVEYRKSEGCGGKEIWDKSSQDAKGERWQERAENLGTK